MTRTAIAFAALLATVLAACGDNGGRGAVDATPGPDASAVVDAAPCTQAWFVPEEVEVGYSGEPERYVTVDGVGTRCEQLIRTMTDPALAPAELVPFLLDQTPSASCVDYVDMSQVQLHGTRDWTGLQLYGDLPAQNAGVIVKDDNRLLSLGGTYLIAGRPEPPCLDATETISSTIGEPLRYFLLTDDCIQFDVAEHPIATDDEIAVATPDLHYDAFTGRIQWIRRLDISLLPSHVTPDMIRSQLDCCAGGAPLHCMGAELYVEMTAGDVIVQNPRCEFTCTPP